jgi:hypothetical protein
MLSRTMKRRQRTEPDAATIREISVAASADPRSVRKELENPGSVRGLPGHRIRAVLEAERDNETSRRTAS